MIINDSIISSVRTRLLKNICSGQAIRFVTTFSNQCRLSDIFIVNMVCNTYVPECVKPRNYMPTSYLRDLEHGERYNKAIHRHPHEFDDFGGAAVTNLRTGKLSYIRGDKKVVLVNAEINRKGDLI